MEEGSQPRDPAELSEQELRTMLEDRERRQTAELGRNRRLATGLLVGLALPVAIGVFATGLHRDLAAVMFPEPPPPGAPRTAAAPSGVDPADAMLKQAAGIPAEGPTGGKIVDPEDIKFTMELMQFMQGPSKQTPPPEAGK